MSKYNNNQQHRIDAIGPEGWRKAFGVLADYLTRKLRGRVGHAPFTQETLGCLPVEYFSMHAYDKLVNGECYWPEDVDLATQLIRNAKSEIERVVHEWVKQQSGSSHPLTKEEAKRELDTDKRIRESALEVAYRIARDSVMDNPQLLSLLNYMRDEPDRRKIAQRMHLPMCQLLIIERQLMSRLRR